MEQQEHQIEPVEGGIYCGKCADDASSQMERHKFYFSLLRVAGDDVPLQYRMGAILVDSKIKSMDLPRDAFNGSDWVKVSYLTKHDRDGLPICSWCDTRLVTEQQQPGWVYRVVTEVKSPLD